MLSKIFSSLEILAQITKIYYKDKFNKKANIEIISLQQQMSNPYRLNTTSKHINPIFLQSISPKNIKAKQLPNIAKNKKKLYPYILSILFIKRIKNSIKRRKHREKILQQWYYTQHSYHLDLDIAINFIKIPLQTANIINQQQAQILFPQIYSMIKLSQMMLQVLQAIKKAGRIHQVYVGLQINKFVKHYKVYSKYFSSHGKRLEIISSLLQKHWKQLKKIQQNMQVQLTRRKSNKQFMSIKDCMDKPLYRIFKYLIMLRQYIKKLDQNHKDYEYTTQCLNSFHQINQNNNELMKKIQQKQKIIKLGKLFGSELGDNKQYITQIQANTIYNKIKLYIFNNILLITKIQQLLGSEIQSKYGVLQFNQFAYCADQDNLKYFKNIVILVSKFKCLHFFFDYQDSKIQFIVAIQNVMKRIRKMKYQFRNIMSCTLFNDQKVKVHKSNSNKEFQDRPKLVNVHPEFIVEIFGFQVRPLGTITHDTVYVARFMIPYYYEDQINLNKVQQNLIKKQLSLTHLDNYKKRLSNTSHQSTQSSQTLSVIVQDNYKISKLKRNYMINQKIQMHFSALQQIHRFVQSLCNEQIPQINQTTTGSKKTKTFQQRKFLIQQFFNYILRNYAIMNNPNWIVQKLKINEDIWNYTARRNAQAKLNQKTRVKSYGFDHCHICLNAKIKSIQQFQQLRQHYLIQQSSKQKKQTDIYCMNFFNLLRLRILNLKKNLFNTIERMATYYHYKQGRIDYPFMLHRRYQQNLKVIKIFFTSVQQRYIEVQLDSRTTVGQVLDELGITLQSSNNFQFDLIATYAQKRRLLDRDQYMMDLIKVLQLKYQQYSIKNSQIRKKSKGSLFNTLKSFGSQIFQSSQQQNKIYIIKTVYLTKCLQLKSYMSNPKKRQLEVQKIFWVIKKGIIKLPFIQFIQLLAPYYCLKQYKEIMNRQLLRISMKKVQKLIPDQFSHIFYYDDQSINQFSSTVASQIQDMLHRNQSTPDKLYAKIIENSYRKPLFHTYFIEVEAKQIPEDWKHASEPLEICLLGINYYNLVIAKKEPNTKIIAQFSIQQLQYSLSVYSIFVTYDSWNFRFDGKMLYHFGELIKKYQTLSRVFLQYMF